ncbi:unnamed protein product [Caenorhabditis bovis]|uniref:Calcineurin-like phosphoesterase domain-containing protein n=1 Tax=Caenorhabditis bovis TaxID=2654633 RepID=A0A8S1F374_9PELO|nr:unnamed protein product [Caenorhabditis bovis]
MRVKTRFLYGVPFLVLLSSLLWNEKFAYYYLSKTWQIQKIDGNCQKWLLVADPQLIGYRREKFGWLARWDSDRYLATGFDYAKWQFAPNAFIFLGDLFDEGLDANDDEWNETYERFVKIFPIDANETVIYIAGDNDIGGEAELINNAAKSKFYHYFRNHVDKLKADFTINETYLFDNPNSKRIVEAYNEPIARILLTHVPYLNSVYKRNPVGHQMDLILSSHDHENGIYEIQRSSPQALLFSRISESSPLYIKTIGPDQPLVEIRSPTCSYRMGVPYMGYGALTICRNRGETQVQYSVLWLPARFYQLLLCRPTPPICLCAKHWNNSDNSMESSIQRYYRMNYTNCPPSTFLDSSDFQATAAHLLSIIVIPTNLFATYLIIYKTPPKMRSMRPALLHIHIWSTICDLLTGFLVVPYVFFPLCTGYGAGILTIFRVAQPFQIYTNVTSIAGVGMGILFLYENRQNNLVQKSVWRIGSKRARLVFVVSNYAFLLTYTLPAFSNIPEQESAKIIQLQIIPCPASDFFNDDVFVLQLTSTLIGELIGLAMLVIVAQIGFFLFHSLIYLTSAARTATLSERTRKMQKKFLRSVTFQVSIPFTVCAIPVGYTILTIFADYYNQKLTNICFIMISLHGFLETCCILVLYPDYWKATLRILRVESITPTKTLKNASMVTNSVIAF